MAGRASWLTQAPGQADPVLAGVVVYAGGAEIEVPLTDARRPLRRDQTYDVVLVGPWPTNPR